MTLAQKMVELRKAIPSITKEKHSDQVKYKFAKIDAIYALITPVMNELGVNFEPIHEYNVHLDVTDRPTKYGTTTMFTYQSDLKCVWVNAEDPTDKIEVIIHTIAWNDDPAKAKGAAWTYALKYYFFEKFNIDMGEDDPDKKQQEPAPPIKKVRPKELDELYKFGEALGYSKEAIQASIIKSFKVKMPTDITSEQCREAYSQMQEKAKEKGEQS